MICSSVGMVQLSFQGQAGELAVLTGGKPRHIARYNPPPQRVCQTRPTVLKLPPVRVITPVPPNSLIEFHLFTGSDSVSPTRVFSCRSSPRAPPTVVRPPV